MGSYEKPYNSYEGTVVMGGMIRGVSSKQVLAILLNGDGLILRVHVFYRLKSKWLLSVFTNIV